jgi:hypothetical protein
MICLAPCVSELLVGQHTYRSGLSVVGIAQGLFCIVRGYGGAGGRGCVGQMCDNTKNDKLGRGSARFVFCKLMVVFVVHPRNIVVICQFSSSPSACQIMPLLNRCKHVHLHKTQKAPLCGAQTECGNAVRVAFCSCVFLVSSTLPRFDRGRTKSPRATCGA